MLNGTAAGAGGGQSPRAMVIVNSSAGAPDPLRAIRTSAREAE